MKIPHRHFDEVQGSIILRFAELNAEDPEKMKNWRYTHSIAKYAAVDTIRNLLGRNGQKRHVALPGSITMVTEAEADRDQGWEMYDASSIADPTDDFSEWETKADLVAALEKADLTADEKKIFRVRVFEDGTQEDAAAVIGLSASRVSQLELRIKAKLQRVGFRYSDTDFNLAYINRKLERKHRDGSAQPAP